MQLIILAAGIGRRLRHVTTDKPKCMVKVNGKTLLEHSLDNVTPDAVRCGISTACAKPAALGLPGMAFR